MVSCITLSSTLNENFMLKTLWRSLNRLGQPENDT